MLSRLLNRMQNFAQAGQPCNPSEGAGQFLGLPRWYDNLPGQTDQFDKCVPTFDRSNPATLWVIGLNIAEIMLVLAGIIAVGFVIWGGIRYITSTGEPDKTKAAKDTILNALIGLVIAIVAANVVSFIGSRLTS